MKWKIFLTVFISGLLCGLPQNIISCGPGIDPYDYYTSFFKQQPSTDGYRPFYYSNYVFLYDEAEPVSTEDELAKEWAAYCGAPVTAADAKLFVTGFDVKQLKNVYYHIEKKQPLTLPDSVNNNRMAGYFIRQKDLEGLGYILYARQVQPYVTGDYNNWEVLQRDTAKMSRLIKNGQQLYNAAKLDFYKLKYAYQLVRLAHYSQQYAAAVSFYDAYVSPNPTKSVLQPLAMSLKAGAMFRLGQHRQAAYYFSKAFSAAAVKRVSNYTSFKWCVSSQVPRDEYLALCKDDTERADMLALFCLSSPFDETNTITKILAMHPNAAVLDVLAVREINKLEEAYYTPLLNKEAGGRTLYYMWENGVADSALNAGKIRTHQLQQALQQAAVQGRDASRALFETGAAYCALMLKAYKQCHSLLNSAAQKSLPPEIKEQWMLINLLLSINETEKLDAGFEKQVLPSLQWLHQKAVQEKKSSPGSWYNTAAQWQQFYRNLVSEVLAKRYHQQGDTHKEVLAIGAADAIFVANDYEGYSNGVDFMRNNLQGEGVNKLYSLMSAKDNSAYDKFLLANNSIHLKQVIDFAGTAYLRDRNYAEAIKWFAKAGNTQTPIHKNPFIELLYDQEGQLPGKPISTTKLAFAKEMQRLQWQAGKDAANASAFYYKIALGLYNTSYYGYAWELVQYYRSGSDGYYLPDSSNTFKKEYYGCYTAYEYFKKAMDAAADVNFKAKCLFMMAKCGQKQLRRPQYDDFNYNWDNYEAAEKKYFIAFRNNPLFANLVKEYKHTPFFKEAYNSCSYLKDFVQANK